MEIFVEAAEMKRKPLRQQRAILLSCIGPLGLQLYRELEKDIKASGKVKFEVEGQESKTEAVHTCEDILNAIGEYYAPYRNITQERYAFFTTIQGTRDVDVFVRELKEEAAECDFCAACKDSLIKDVLLIGMSDGSLRRKLLDEPRLTLSEAVLRCRSAQIMQGVNAAIQNEDMNRAVRRGVFSRRAVALSAVDFFSKKYLRLGALRCLCGELTRHCVVDK